MTLARQLSLPEKVCLIEQLAPEIERDMRQQRTDPPGQDRLRPMRSLLGLCADLGPAPSAEEIDQIHKEMWIDTLDNCLVNA